MKYTLTRYLTALPLAIAALGTSAVELSQDGRGDVLLYPFYSAEGGNDTYISVANNTDHPKALRVRFREGLANEEVLSFNLYLRPRDHWAGAVTTASQNSARLVSSDDSCTYPAQPDGGFVFSNSSYADDHINGLERTREGMVEIIEMGILDDEETHSEKGPWGAVKGIFGEGIYFPMEGLDPSPLIHGCYVINLAWESGYGFADEPSRNIGAATGGLSGYGVVINVSEGTNITYNAVALKNFFDGSFLHSHPDDASPSLADAAPVARIYHEDNGLIELETENGVDAVSSVLIRSEISSDLVMEPGIDASTEWVINFPMLSYALGSLQMKVYDRQGESSIARDRNIVDFAVGSTGDHGIYPGNAVNVLEFGNAQPILHASSRIGSSIGVKEGVANGHAVLDLRTYKAWSNYADGNHKASFNTAHGTLRLTGIPVIGFTVQKYVNGNLNGILSNYTGTLNYHTTLDAEVLED